MTTRDGIEIDYCPDCRGVWLDRGELDKLIERSNGNGFSTERSNHSDDRHDDRRYEHDNRDEKRYDDRRYEHRDDHHDSHGHHKKKESFMGDLFDF